VIIPLTSVLLNPCAAFKGLDLQSWYRFDKKSPVTFLIFDKRTKEFFAASEI